MNCSSENTINKMTMDNGYILPNKTNFINFISDFESTNSFLNQFRKWLPEPNSGVYDELVKSQESLKIYQLLVSNYLQENSPYRGLLLYHGLGAGKTAASITIAEGYINRKVMVFLPASITNTFKSEVERFTIFNKENYLWRFCNKFIYSDDPTEDNLIEYGKYLDNSNYKKTVNTHFYDLGIDIESMKEEEFTNFTYQVDGKRYIGVWLPDLSQSGSNYNDLNENERLTINSQVYSLNEFKYNYYSYNGSNFIEKIITDNLDNMKSGINEDSVVKLEKYLDYRDVDGKRLKKTRQEENIYIDLIMSMNNPFDNKTIIIDEVHNFISLVKNGSKKGTLAYLLLMKAKNIRLVFLSATPAINEPFELSIMINLLKGYVNEYSLRFTYDITENVNIDTIRDIIENENTIDRYETLIKVNKNTVSLSLVRNESSFIKVKELVDCENFPPNACRGLVKSDNIEDCNFNKCNEQEYIEYLKKKIGAKEASYDIKPYSIFPDIAELFGSKLIINKQSINNAVDSFKTNYIKIINDKLIIHNERDFIKRSLGCISYFGGIDIEVLKALGHNIGYPSKKEYIMTSLLSYEQYEVYKLERDDEIQKDNKKRMMIDQDIPSTFRSTSRQALLCIYPQAEMKLRKELKSNKSLSKDEKYEIESQIIDSISYDDIHIYSPKYNNVINISNTSPGPVLLYSNYYSMEGLTSLRKYMILGGYSDLNLKEKDINTEYFENRIGQFREKRDELIGKMIIFKLDSKSKSYLDYCRDKYNILEESDFELKIEELQTNLENPDILDELKLKIQAEIDFLMEEVLYLRGQIIEYDEETDLVKVSYSTLNSGYMEIQDYKPSIETHYTFSDKIVEVKREDIFPATIVVLFSGKKGRQRYIDIFNNMNNKYGQYISCILATDVIAEGINLSFIRQVNIINPYWNKVKTDQVIGRATRMKSHLYLQYHQRNVEVFHHLMEFTPEQIKIQIDNRLLIIDKTLTTDQYLYNVGLIKESLIKQFLKILKEVSIDCDINQSGNFMKKESDIRCVSHLNEKIYGFRYDIFSYNLNSAIMDDSNSFLGMPTKTTFMDSELHKYTLSDNSTFHIFNDSKFYYNFYRFIFSTNHILGKKNIIKSPKSKYMTTQIEISEMTIHKYELRLWNWLDKMIVLTIESLVLIEDIDIKLMNDYVYKLLCNFNNPMLSDHICNLFKINSIKTDKRINQPLVDDLLTSEQDLDNSLCNIIKYEVIGKLYELINTNLSDIIDIENLGLVLKILEQYRETEEYYNILLKLFKSNFDDDDGPDDGPGVDKTDDGPDDGPVDDKTDDVPVDGPDDGPDNGTDDGPGDDKTDDVPVDGP